jgi:ferredoxin
MTIFYLTGTGNSLAVAKSICEGETLISIPQVADVPDAEYKDDVIGVVFPVYYAHAPQMVRSFLAKAKLTANYMFAIGTYGYQPGACLWDVQHRVVRRGNPFDYVGGLATADNYLPKFDMDVEISRLPDKHIEENLSRIAADIAVRKKQPATASASWRLVGAFIRMAERSLTKNVQAKSFHLDTSCDRCGICAKVCPAGNIAVTDTVTFGDSCECCLGCVHHCPKIALHVKGEQSAARWRNPHTTLAEIVRANNRTA